jgi:predicted SAM-dependent methyltransferase
MNRKDLYINIDEFSIEFARDYITKIKPYLDAVMRHIRDTDAPILEVGAEVGLESIYLEQRGFKNIFCVFDDPQAIGKFDLKTRGKFNSKIQAAYADPFDIEDLVEDLGYLGCIHHYGLVNRIGDLNEVRKLLNLCVSLSEKAVFAIDGDMSSQLFADTLAGLNLYFDLIEYGSFPFGNYFVIREKIGKVELEDVKKEITEKDNKLNLGCGTDIRDGFINIDFRALPGVDIVSDVRHLDMFDDETCSYILAQDIIEHFPIAETNNILREWTRVLQTNGILEIQTPNMAWAAKHYSENKNAEFVSYHIFGGQDYEGNNHYVMFDRVWLKNLCLKFDLEEIEFKEEGSNIRIKYKKI